MKFEKASLDDAEQIQDLINYYARRNKLIQRSLAEIYECIREYYVCKTMRGRIIGCCSLHIYWRDLAEVRALAVARRFQNRGIGSTLVKKCIEEAKMLGIKKVFTLTYVPKFFEALGFRRIKKEELPMKVWAECIRCSKFQNCDEIALIANIRKV
ncbi:MAG: N-acetyltransferase [Candidatus Micrarchaeia archaeon]